MNYEMCPHGRHVGAVCIPCAEEAGMAPNSGTGLGLGAFLDVNWKLRDDEKPARENVKKTAQPSGLDAEYYDLPDNVRTAQDLIEWLDLNFSNGNIVKSMIREYNPNVSKETDALYEAEKRYFFASRHLQRVRQMQ